MTKLLLGLALVGLGAFLGYFFSKKFRKRKDFFFQFSQFNDRFLTEINYYRRPLTKFLTEYSYKGEFDVLLEYFYQTLRADASGSRKSFAIGKEELTFLTADELAFVQNYFQTIGKGDSQSQKAFFGGASSQLCSYKDDATEKAKKYGDLYIKLGVLLGIAALIIVI